MFQLRKALKTFLKQTVQLRTWLHESDAAAASSSLTCCAGLCSVCQVSTDNKPHFDTNITLSSVTSSDHDWSVLGTSSTPPSAPGCAQNRLPVEKRRWQCDRWMHGPHRCFEIRSVWRILRLLLACVANTLMLFFYTSVCNFATCHRLTVRSRLFKQTCVDVWVYMLGTGLGGWWPSLRPWKRRSRTSS